MKFRKKPVVVDAYQTDKEMYIETLEGTMHAKKGDWIITGVNGEQYPCKPDIFEKTYEPADQEETVKPEQNQIIVPIGNGLNLVAEQNLDSSFDKEIFVFVEKDGRIIQDLAMVGLDYVVDNDLNVQWKQNKFDIRQWLNPLTEDFTTMETVDLLPEEYWE